MSKLVNAMSRVQVHTLPSGFWNQPCGTINHGSSLYHATRSRNSTDSLTSHHRTPNIKSPWFDDDYNYGAALVTTYCPCSGLVIVMKMIPRGFNVYPVLMTLSLPLSEWITWDQLVLLSQIFWMIFFNLWKNWFRFQGSGLSCISHWWPTDQYDMSKVVLFAQKPRSLFFCASTRRLFWRLVVVVKICRRETTNPWVICNVAWRCNGNMPKETSIQVHRRASRFKVYNCLWKRFIKVTNLCLWKKNQLASNLQIHTWKLEETRRDSTPTVKRIRVPV